MKTAEQWSYEFAQVQMNDPAVHGQMLPHPQTVEFFKRIQSDAEQEGFKRGWKQGMADAADVCDRFMVLSDGLGYESSRLKSAILKVRDTGIV